MVASRVDTARALVENLLDRGYTQATQQVIGAIVRQSSEGLIAQRLQEFDAECQRLQADKQPLTRDNAVLRALVADFETTLRRQAGLVDAAAGDVMQAGVNAAGVISRQLTLPGLNDVVLNRLGLAWNQPDPEAINALVQYANSDAWASELAAFGPDTLSIANQMAIRGVAEGRGPLAIAKDIRGLVETFPAYKANNLLRTMQLTSYRDATALSYVANADILDGQIRIATLDARTCMACVALHGTVMKIGERVNDHHQGRCTSVGMVKGRARNVQTGEDWFNALPENQQQQMMGAGAYDAWKSGKFGLQEYPQPYTDKVFGEMVREASLKGLLKK